MKVRTIKKNISFARWLNKKTLRAFREGRLEDALRYRVRHIQNIRRFCKLVGMDSNVYIQGLVEEISP